MSVLLNPCLLVAIDAKHSFYCAAHDLTVCQTCDMTTCTCITSACYNASKRDSAQSLLTDEVAESLSWLSVPTYACLSCVGDTYLLMGVLCLDNAVVRSA